MQYSKNLILDNLRLLIKCYVNENNLIIKNKVRINKKKIHPDGIRMGGHYVELYLEDILGQIYPISHELTPGEMNKLMPASTDESEAVTLFLEDSFTYPERDMVIYKHLREKRTPTIRKYLKRVIKQQEMIWNMPVNRVFISLMNNDEIHLFIHMTNFSAAATQIKNIQVPKIYFNELKFLSELPTTSLFTYLSDTMDSVWDIKLLYPKVKFKVEEEEFLPEEPNENPVIYLKPWTLKEREQGQTMISDVSGYHPFKTSISEIASSAGNRTNELAPSEEMAFKTSADSLRMYESSELPNMQSWTTVDSGGTKCKH